MNLLFVWQLKHAGLALAISLGACINAGLLYYHLRRDDIFRPQPGWLLFVFKLLLAAGAMAAVLWFGMGAQSAWLHYGFAEKIMRLTLLVSGGALTYFAVLWLLGIRPRDFMRRATA